MFLMSTRVRSFCKINLGLAVGPPRADGFHALTTVYQTIGLHDIVTVSAKRAAETRITLTANHPAVPRTEVGNAERNTAWKMVAGALERLGLRAEVHIKIEKRLPVQGGLGAGSANAAAALLGLERELGVTLAGPERLLLAAEVGSDVPLFLLGGTVLGMGRGEQVFPLPDAAAVPCVVAVPSVGVSTAQAFRELDARMRGGEGTGSREQGAGPQGLKPASSAARDGGAEAPPLQSTPRLKPLLSGDSFSGLKAAAPSRSAEINGATEAPPLQSTPGLEPLLSGDSFSGLKAAAPSPSAEIHGAAEAPPLQSGDASALTFALRANRLKELSRVLASVWTTTGAELDVLSLTADGHGPSGITRRTGDLAELTGVFNPLLALVRTGIENDFEEVAFSQRPSLRSTKRDLVGDGYPGDSGCALYAALSGSGSALFGLYRSQTDAIAAQQRVQAAGTQALLTETLSRTEYWASMFAE